MDESQMQAACDAFVATFLPPGVASSHHLLYPPGHDDAEPWAPTQQQANACVAAFHRLLHPVNQAGALALIGVLPLDVTELVLSYLERLQPARVTSHEAQQVAAIIRHREPELDQLVTLLGGSGHDARKRLVAIADLLAPAAP